MASVDGDTSSFDTLPSAARTVTTLEALIGVAIVVFCSANRAGYFKQWRTLTTTKWLLIIIYADILAFIITTAVLTKSYSVDYSAKLCDVVIILCILFYFSNKIAVYYFFAEKVHIVRNPWIPRTQDKLYLFNIFGVICPYIVLVVVGFIYRRSEIGDHHHCQVGFHRPALISVTVFDFCTNIWLTCLFIQPLRQLHSDTNRSLNPAIKTMATRTFIGSCVTTFSAMMNAAFLTVYAVEWYWICLFVCNLDLIVTAIAMFWATSIDAPEVEAESWGPPPANMVMRNPSEAERAASNVKSRGFVKVLRGSLSVPAVSHPDDLPDFDLRSLGTLTDEKKPAARALSAV